MKKRNITPLDFYRMCYTLSPDIMVSVYSATKGNLPLWKGEFRSMPLSYRNATIEDMNIFAKDSKIVKLTFALRDRSIDYGKA